MPSSTNDIFNSAQAQILALGKVSQAISAKINAIENVIGPQGLTTGHRAQVAALRAQQKSVDNAAQKLALVTMEALDNSNEIAIAATEIQAAKGGLDAVAAQITRIGGDAVNIGAIATQIGILFRN